MNPNARWGENTIEHAFAEDVKEEIERSGSTTVTARSEYEIDVFGLELGEEHVNTIDIFGGSYDVNGMIYNLTVPAELELRNGEDVRVEGREFKWMFEDVQVTSNENGVTVSTTRIRKISYE